MLGFVSDAFLLSCFLNFFLHGLKLIAMEWELCVVQHGRCLMQLLRSCSSDSLFPNRMQIETSMHLLFTGHMKIARCCRYLSGLWLKHKTDCQEGAVCSNGMEVVMSKKKDCNTLGVYISENFYLLSLFIWISWGDRPIATGLSSRIIKVPVHKFLPGEPSWRLIPVHHPKPNSWHEIKYLHRNTQIISHLLQG